MSGDEVSSTFKRCRSAIDLTDPVLRRIAREINLAEVLLLQYLNEATTPTNVTETQMTALNHLSQLIVKELKYLRKVKGSEVVSVSGSFVTFRSDDGEFLVTVVPEEELQKNFHPFFCFQNIRPRFAKPVASRDSFAVSSQSAESVYYDAVTDDAGQDLPASTSQIGRTIYGLLKYIFASTIGRLESDGH